jgi:hypothetical protein
MGLRNIQQVSLITWWLENCFSVVFYTVPGQKKQFEADVTKSGAQVFWNDNIASDESIPKFLKIILPAFPMIISFT